MYLLIIILHIFFVHILSATDSIFLCRRRARFSDDPLQLPITLVQYMLYSTKIYNAIESNLTSYVQYVSARA